VAVAIHAGERQTRLLPYIAYGLAVPAVVLILAITLLSMVRRRA
jgi:hypothetical protein